MAYIKSRMARAGVKDQTVFPRELMEEIHFRAQAFPASSTPSATICCSPLSPWRAKIATLAMLDEVTADMRLEYPGQRPFRPDTTYPERTMRRSQVP